MPYIMPYLTNNLLIYLIKYPTFRSYSSHTFRSYSCPTFRPTFNAKLLLP